MNKLYRSQTDKMIAGVCGGLGHYLNIDVTLVRLFFLLLAVAGGGTGFVLYLVLWILLPYPEAGDMGSTDTIRSGADEIAAEARKLGSSVRNATGSQNQQAGLIVGLGLILLGFIILVDKLNIWWLHWLNFGTLWPLALIAGGAVLLARHSKENLDRGTGHEA